MAEKIILWLLVSKEYDRELAKKRFFERIGVECDRISEDHNGIWLGAEVDENYLDTRKRAYLA